MTMLIYFLAIALGLILLVWSADKFVDGASGVAEHYGMPPLLIGMIIVGFGTSAPELVVSCLAALEGSPGIAIGNAYGSNITNIGMILGLTALLMPITVHSKIIKKEIPILIAVTLLSVVLILDFDISRIDAVILLVVFAGIIGHTVWQGLTQKNDELAKEFEAEFQEVKNVPIKKSYLYLGIGLLLLIISSRILVYGAVGVASAFGVSDIVIGLTVVAVGTSLPELASSLIAARKGEADIAIGNVIGSNFFNTLAVVGLAGVLRPLSFEPIILYRDVSIMVAFTILVLVLSYKNKSEPKINRTQGGFLLISYIAYVAYLISTVA